MGFRTVYRICGEREKMKIRGLKSIKILGKTMKIVWDNGPTDNGANFGLMDHKAQVITLNATVSDDELEDTLIHEVLHSLSHQLSLGLEHKIVNPLSAGLHQVLKDNGCWVRKKKG